MGKQGMLQQTEAFDEGVVYNSPYLIPTLKMLITIEEAITPRNKNRKTQ